MSEQSPENVPPVQAHDTYMHGEDGRVCIALADCWFVPLDAGGEGFACERHHGPTRVIPPEVTA